MEYFSLGSCLAPLISDDIDRRDSPNLWSIKFFRSADGIQERILLLVITFSMIDDGMMSTRSVASLSLDIIEMVLQGIVVRNQGSDKKWMKGLNSEGEINVGRDG